MRRDPARRPTARRIAVSALAVAAMTVPLAACATGEAGGVGLVRSGCPVDIRIQTDDLPRVEWGFLYGLLDPDEVTVTGDSVSGPLSLDGADSGVTLTILVGGRDDDPGTTQALYRDESILLASVDTDRAVLDFRRNPTVGVFAPLLRNPRIAYWDTAVYPGVENLPRFNGRFLPDGSALVPVVTEPGGPYRGYAVGKRLLSAEQLEGDTTPSVDGFVEAAGLAVHTGDALVDPHLLSLPTGWAQPVRSRLLEDTGYRSDANVLSARPQTIVRYGDCFEVLVPLLQQALVDYLTDPAETTEFVVELAARFGDERYDTTAAAVALGLLQSEDFVGNGRDDTIGDFEIGRVRELLDDAVAAWKRAEVAVPADVELDAIVTNRFIDRTIGLPR